MPAEPLIPEYRKDDIVALVAQDLSDEQIADRYHCSRATVIAFRVKHGIRKNRIIPSASTGPAPIRTYFDASVNHLVKVYAPGHASGDLAFEGDE